MNNNIYQAIIFIILVVALLVLLFFFKEKLFAEKTTSDVDALNKGFGYYSDKQYGECVDEGICGKVGKRRFIQYCIPHPETGYGCLDEEGFQNFDLKVGYEPCTNRCQQGEFIDVSNNKCENVLDPITGKDITHVIFGEKTISNNKEVWKGGTNCIPNRGFISYTEKKYKCVGKNDTGESGCEYRCGNDYALNKSYTVGRGGIINIDRDNLNKSNMLQSYPFIIEKDINGNDIRRNVCYDINGVDQLLPLTIQNPLIDYPYFSKVSSGIKIKLITAKFSDIQFPLRNDMDIFKDYVAGNYHIVMTAPYNFGDLFTDESFSHTYNDQYTDSKFIDDINVARTISMNIEFDYVPYTDDNKKKLAITFNGENPIVNFKSAITTFKYQYSRDADEPKGSPIYLHYPVTRIGGGDTGTPNQIWNNSPCMLLFPTISFTAPKTFSSGGDIGPGNITTWQNVQLKISSITDLSYPSNLPYVSSYIEENNAITVYRQSGDTADVTDNIFRDNIDTIYGRNFQFDDVSPSLKSLKTASRSSPRPYVNFSNEDNISDLKDLLDTEIIIGYEYQLNETSIVKYIGNNKDPIINNSSYYITTVVFSDDGKSIKFPRMQLETKPDDVNTNINFYMVTDSKNYQGGNRSIATESPPYIAGYATDTDLSQKDSTIITTPSFDSVTKTYYELDICYGYNTYIDLTKCTQDNCIEDTGGYQPSLNTSSGYYPKVNSSGAAICESSMLISNENQPTVTVENFIFPEICYSSGVEISNISNLTSPYIEDEDGTYINSICYSNGKPVPDGTIVKIQEGQTVVINQPCDTFAPLVNGDKQICGEWLYNTETFEDLSQYSGNNILHISNPFRGCDATLERSDIIYDKCYLPGDSLDNIPAPPEGYTGGPLPGIYELGQYFSNGVAGFNMNCVEDPTDIRIWDPTVKYKAGDRVFVPTGTSLTGEDPNNQAVRVPQYTCLSDIGPVKSTDYPQNFPEIWRPAICLEPKITKYIAPSELSKATTSYTNGDYYYTYDVTNLEKRNYVYKYVGKELVISYLDIGEDVDQEFFENVYFPEMLDTNEITPDNFVIFERTNLTAIDVANDYVNTYSDLGIKGMYKALYQTIRDGTKTSYVTSSYTNYYFIYTQNYAAIRYYIWKDKYIDDDGDEVPAGFQEVPYTIYPTLGIKSNILAWDPSVVYSKYDIVSVINYLGDTEYYIYTDSGSTISNVTMKQLMIFPRSNLEFNPYFDYGSMLSAVSSSEYNTYYGCPVIYSYVKDSNNYSKLFRMTSSIQKFQGKNAPPTTASDYWTLLNGYKNVPFSGNSIEDNYLVYPFGNEEKTITQLGTSTFITQKSWLKNVIDTTKNNWILLGEEKATSTDESITEYFTVSTIEEYLKEYKNNDTGFGTVIYDPTKDSRKGTSEYGNNPARCIIDCSYFNNSTTGRAQAVTAANVQFNKKHLDAFNVMKLFSDSTEYLLSLRHTPLTIGTQLLDSGKNSILDFEDTGIEASSNIYRQAVFFMKADPANYNLDRLNCDDPYRFLGEDDNNDTITQFDFDNSLLLYFLPLDENRCKILAVFGMHYFGYLKYHLDFKISQDGILNEVDNQNIYPLVYFCPMENDYINNFTDNDGNRDSDSVEILFNSKVNTVHGRDREMDIFFVDEDSGSTHFNVKGYPDRTFDETSLIEVAFPTSHISGFASIFTGSLTNYYKMYRAIGSDSFYNKAKNLLINDLREGRNRKDKCNIFFDYDPSLPRSSYTEYTLFSQTKKYEDLTGNEATLTINGSDNDAYIDPLNNVNIIDRLPSTLKTLTLQNMTNVIFQGFDANYSLVNGAIINNHMQNFQKLVLADNGLENALASNTTHFPEIELQFVPSSTSYTWMSNNFSTIKVPFKLTLTFTGLTFSGFDFSKISGKCVSELVLTTTETSYLFDNYSMNNSIPKITINGFLSRQLPDESVYYSLKEAFTLNYSTKEGELVNILPQKVSDYYKQTSKIITTFDFNPSDTSQNTFFPFTAKQLYAPYRTSFYISSPKYFNGDLINSTWKTLTIDMTNTSLGDYSNVYLGLLSSTIENLTLINWNKSLNESYLALPSLNLTIRYTGSVVPSGDRIVNGDLPATVSGSVHFVNS